MDRQSNNASSPRVNVTRADLEALYVKFNHRHFVHPDPLEFVYEYNQLRDREVVGLVASSLAFGRVAQILVSVRKVLDVMGQSPADYLLGGNLTRFRDDHRGFVHRYADGESVALLLEGIRLALREYGSLEEVVLRPLGDSSTNILPGMQHLVGCLQSFPEWTPHPLLSCPSMGSACKRLNLFLRWMVRKDHVDPGGWDRIAPRLLVVPLDTHLYRIAGEMGLTQRRSPDLKCALEITQGFAGFCAEDPVRYDFALTRPGIWAHFGPQAAQQPMAQAPDGDDHAR